MSKKARPTHFERPWESVAHNQQTPIDKHWPNATDDQKEAFAQAKLAKKEPFVDAEPPPPEEEEEE